MIAGERVANGLWQHIRLPLRRFLSLPSAGTHLTHTPQPATLSSNTSSLSDPRSLPLTTRPPTLSPTPCDADNTQTQTPLSVYLTRTTQGLIHTAPPPPALPPPRTAFYCYPLSFHCNVGQHCVATARHNAKKAAK